MEISFLSILALGFVLGIKHAIEPDHVIAVSTIASQSKKFIAFLVSWSVLGHWPYCNIINCRCYSYFYER